MKRMLKLIVDDREGAVIPFFATHASFAVVVQRIQIGDYIITQNDKIIAAIERKSWCDLAASIKDGRVANINKLLGLRQTTGCRLFYLMEGKSRYTPDKRFARIPYKNLQAHLDHLIMRDNVCMLYADNPADTAARLAEFMTNYLSLPNNTNTIVPAGHSVIVTGGTPTIGTETNTSELDILTVTMPKTDDEIISNMWCCVPNITTKTVPCFTAYHIADLFLGSIDIATVAAMCYTNGSVIGKRAKKITSVATNNIANHAIYCRVLAEIPGLTKRTAALILVQIKFIDLLRGIFSIQQLADIKKTEKSRIGEAVAKKIYKFLVQI